MEIEEISQAVSDLQAALGAQYMALKVIVQHLPQVRSKLEQMTGAIQEAALFSDLPDEHTQHAQRWLQSLLAVDQSAAPQHDGPSGQDEALGNVD